MRENVRTLACHIAAFTLFGIAINCYLFWAPTLMIRTHGWDAPQAGHVIGAMMFVLGTAGVYCGGWLADRLAATGRRDAILRAAFFGMLCGVPFLRATPLLNDERLATAGTRRRHLFHGVSAGSAFRRAAGGDAQSTARADDGDLFLHRQPRCERTGTDDSRIAGGLRVQGPRQLRYALFFVEVVVLPLSLLFLYFGLRAYGASVERAE